MNLSLMEILAAQGRRGLGSLIVVPMIGGSLAGSVSPYIKRQQPMRYHLERSKLRAAASLRKAVIESQLRLVSRAVLSPGAVGLSGMGLAGVREDMQAALEAARAAQADLMALSGSLSDSELDGFAQQAAYKAYGETLGRLGLPLSLGSFNINAAYQGLRSTVTNSMPASLGNWLARVPDLTASAGGFLLDAELQIHNYMGGTLDQAVGIERTLRDGLRRVGGNIFDLTGGLAQSVEAGGLGIVQDAMAVMPDWLDSHLVGQVGTTISNAIAAGQSGDLGKVFEAIGGGVMAIGAVAGPAAPFVMAAGGLMMIGGMLADVFGASSGPPAPRPARIASEHWGAFKLLYAASIDGSASASIQNVASEWISKVFGDPNTGETMVQPMPGWTGTGRIATSVLWPHAMRMIDMFDRRALVENDRVASWVRTGHGITFDGREDTPATLWATVPNTDPFVKFAGAMASSPAPYPTGGATTGDGSWPVGPANLYATGYYSSPPYRAAYVAAAALGGCPPFASYGLSTHYAIAADYLESAGLFHCTGVGGRIDTSDTRLVRWIPWASVYCPSPYPGTTYLSYDWLPPRANTLYLIPPRRVPFHLQGLGPTNGEFRKWLFTGKVIPSHLNVAQDPEYIVGWSVGAGGTRTAIGPGGGSSPTLVAGNAESQRIGMTGNPGDRMMTLAEFFRDWYGKPYDENEPCTWFMKGTPAVGSGFSILRPSMTSLTAMQKAAADAAKWSTGTKFVVGAAVVGVPIGLYFLGRALRWWK